MTNGSDELIFEAPGPGGWRRLADHFPRALTVEYQRIYAETCPIGMARYMASYGVLARTLDVGIVHGHLYIAPVPLAGPRGAAKAPPRFAVWALARLHPEFRRRNRVAARSLRERPWRVAAERWFVDEQHHWRGRCVAVAEVEPSALDTAALAQHLSTARELTIDGYVRHFELHGADLLPVGLLMVRAQEWGLDARRVSSLLAGPPPEPAEPPSTAAWQLVTGYDLDSLARAEVGAEGSETAPTHTLGRGAHGTPTELAGEALPAGISDQLEVLVLDARLACALRDHNGMLTGGWPMGLLRRAMLEAGHRLHIAPADLAVELTVGELLDALSEPDGAHERLQARAVERAEVRERCSRVEAPGELGPELDIPPLSALPRPLALIGAAQLAVADGMATGDEAIGIGERVYCGRALVATDPGEAFGALEPGDVVVTSATSPSWNALLVEAGALVTTEGGVVSHAALIARELGLPAVVGHRGGTTIRTGDQVEVDPRRATVRVLTVAAGSSTS